MDSDKNITCEVCGAPATSLVRDILDETWPDVDGIHSRPIGPVHRFCKEHARPPVSILCEYWHCRNEEESNHG